MPEQVPAGEPVRLCPADQLVEGGRAHVFDLLEWQRPVRAFVLRFDGQVHGYINRCAHVPVELDWQPGRVFDETGRWVICAVHGATYDPGSGLCVAGPCVHKRLKPITVREEAGLVYWYPSAELAAAPAS